VNTPANRNDENFEEASTQLNEGLRSCRAVVSGYRALLLSEVSEEPGTPAFSEVRPSVDEALA
jgi:hypothetical protein